MRKHLFWKATLSIILVLGSHSTKALEIQVTSLSEGACWYEFKESLKVSSFNDKSSYSGDKEQIQAELESLITQSLAKSENPKFHQEKMNEMNLSLHCGGYGASLVARVSTDNLNLCLWSRFEKGKLLLRSIGALADGGKNPTELCDGHRWGELIAGIESKDLLNELQSSKWSSMIKEIKVVTNKVVKIVLVKEYEFREQEVIDQLEVNFSGKNLIRYVEFNDYRHPIGESVSIK